MNVAEIVGAILAALGIATALVRVVRGAFRRDAALERVARWFPDEHPNGEESLPAQVKRLHVCIDRMSKRVLAVEDRLKKVEKAVGE